MAAYASLLSLAQTLHQILDLHRYNDNPLVDKEKVVPLLEKVDFIVDFLEDYSDKHCAGAVNSCFGNRMQKAAYEAQDFMDSFLYSVSRIKGDDDTEVSVDLQDLNLAVERISFLYEESMKIKNSDAAADLRPITHRSSPLGHSSTVKVSAENKVVGFDDDLIAIRERLYEDSTKLEVIPIVGMGGIGKTTLARRAYEDSLFSQHFDICAWITLSQEYQRTEILSRLFHCVKKPSDRHSDMSEAQLAKLVYQRLVGRRYLIVIDDIWSIKAWDDFKMIFTDDDMGSRILLTTRLSEVAVHAGSSTTHLHEMKFLDEEQSWQLLKESIFGRESCPLELVDSGKKIAINCGGLPLTIVVIAGLLLSSSNTMKKELWENISENVSSKEPTIAMQCSKILRLSYDRLPLRLKPCFLYIATFPEDSEIDVSRLIKLWVAEGFLKPVDDESKSLEDVGELCLKDLVNRSMILVSEKWPDEKLKTITIHDLLRDICILEAENEGFLHCVSPIRNASKDSLGNPTRRLTIHCTLSEECRIQDSNIRSVLVFAGRYLGPRLSICCTRLSILDSLQVSWPNLANVISTFVNLRYIAFVLNYGSCPHGFPASVSKLPNLQTIIAHVKYYNRLEVPYEILEMPKLRHLIMDAPFRLSYPSSIGTAHESDLQTLDTVMNFRCTEEAIKTIANLKKLKVVFDMDHDDWDDFNLNNLFRLQKLEELLVSMISMHDLPNPYSMIWNYAFPVSLKKLTLRGVPLPWENMSIIGSLPNLQVLEMIEMLSINVDEVSEWKPTEGEFVRLKYFRSSLDYLVKWEVEKEHFPCLEILILRHAKWIDEIPSGIGEIDSLRLIELQGCWESLVNSAKQIQEQQHENGNDAFQVRVVSSSSW